MEIKVVYHPNPIPHLDPLNQSGPAHPPSIGLKVLMNGAEYGTYQVLKEGHTIHQALLVLGKLTQDLVYGGLVNYKITEGVPIRSRSVDE